VIVADVFPLYLFSRGGGEVLSACVGLVAGVLPAAMVCSVPTVFCRLGCRFGVQSVVYI
jgi:hypothetical protein